LKKGLALTGILCWLSLALAVSADTIQKLGDGSDGSRAVPVHLLGLYDESGASIAANDDRAQPFSMRQTCRLCHTYESIGRGRHFNYTDPNVACGRTGQPWILVDAATRTQIPVSYRSWPGTYRPEQLGVSPFKFVELFGRHLPGGGAGELDSNIPEEGIRQLISGKLEINCLACHNANPGQDQAEYAGQVTRENFRWAITASCGFASVSGSAAAQPDTYDPLMSDAIKVAYRRNAFDFRNRVLFNIVRKAPAERCYFCHSNLNLDGNDSERWTQDEDVHLSAGLTCVDCHRNGLEHNIVRGYEGEDRVSKNPLASTSTCEGCHLGTGSSAAPAEGRLGAPRPKHPGIPPIHFDKLTCTACHSGLWPGEQACRTKTSRAHGLGTYNVNKSADALPHVLTPVFARGADGKITPHKLFWPAFWGVVKDANVGPVGLEAARRAVGQALGEERAPRSGDWLPLTREQIGKVLSAMATEESVEGKPVYICGGKLYRLDGAGNVLENEHGAAKPCLWPIAHEVRPASQSLGVRNCQDCHATDAPFFFGKVAVDCPVGRQAQSVKTMVDFEQLKPFYVKAFAMSFVFRPWLKLVILGSCAGLAGVLVLYALRALASVVKVLSEENSRGKTKE